jgi:coenzyme Q-binding protein COQ10
MPKFETTRRVAHAPETMFDLVADVERYPEFVPMCERLVVKRRSEANGVTMLVADMAIGYKMISETFTTRVEIDRANLAIRVTYIDGPFKHLENRWTFLPAGAAGASASREPGTTSLADASVSDVKFFIDYEFKSRTFQMLAGAVFEKVFRKMAEAFETRADAQAARSA